MGLPTVIIYFADNQTPIAEHMKSAGTSLSIGKYSKISSKEIAIFLNKVLISHKMRAKLSCRQKELVDGNGCSKIMTILGEKINQL